MMCKSSCFVLTLMLFSCTVIWAQSLPIVNGAASHLPRPEYPKEAEEFCADGEVRVRINAKDGWVSSAKALSGDELLRPVAVAAAKKTRFKLHPIPFFGPGIIVYNFEPKQKCQNAGIVNDRARVFPKPEIGSIVHPKHLRLGKTEVVEVQIIVNIEGNVTQARAISGHPLLRTACVFAASKAKFSPVFDLPPVKVRATLRYRINPDGTVDL